MARMRMLLSQIDQVSAGEVVYPPGGRLGPRWQRDVQLVLVHAGSAWITVDGRPRATLEAGAVGLLLPGHREHFAFAADRPTRHSWVQARVADPPMDRLAALPAALPASTALTELVREAVAVARTTAVDRRAAARRARRRGALALRRRGRVTLARRR